VLEDGDVLELTSRRTEDRHSSASHVYVDGLSVGDIDSVVLRDRKMLSKDGFVHCDHRSQPGKRQAGGRPISCRGASSLRRVQDMIEESRDLVARGP